MFGGELRKDFAVELESVFLQFRYEGTVRLVAVGADGGVQPDDPELAEIILLIAPVGKGISARAHKRLVRVTLLLRTYTAIALGSFENILAALLRHDPTFDSCHT